MKKFYVTATYEVEAINLAEAQAKASNACDGHGVLGDIEYIVEGYLTSQERFERSKDV